jgi:hypothetical protein
MVGLNLPSATMVVRVAGLVIVFVCAAAGTTPRSAVAEEVCRDYTMQECMNSASCFEVAETPCGIQAGQQCDGLGVVACGLGSGCDGAKVTMVCDFEEAT